MHFDLSEFTTVGKWLFDTGINFFKSFEFDFVGYTVNGFALIIGFAIVCIVGWFLGKIFD